MTESKIRIGTRGSALATTQTGWVKQQLLQAHPALSDAEIEIVTITTTGDRITDRPLNAIGGKGLFTKEIEEALLDGRIDMAVHSMKDMPTKLPDGLAIGCIPVREDPRDAFLSSAYDSMHALPAGSRIGTTSLRRSSILKHQRPDVEITPLRGNVTTRIRKLEEGAFDAIILAAAGLHRLGLQKHITAYLAPETMLPAVGQGALAIELLLNNKRINDILIKIHHQDTALCVTAERAMLAELDGSCHTPIGGYATMHDNQQLTLHGLIAEPDGSNITRHYLSGPATDAEFIGRELGKKLAAQHPGFS